jgi:sec-independent protein translocase protein TatA
MYGFSMPELLIVLIVIVLLLGPGRLAKTIGELGKGIRSFRESVGSSEEKSASVSDTNTEPK